MARNMKQQVKELLALGFNDEQIIRYFESSYGEFIRLEPTRGLNLIVWLAPLLGLGLGVPRDPPAREYDTTSPETRRRAPRRCPRMKSSHAGCCAYVKRCMAGLAVTPRARSARDRAHQLDPGLIAAGVGLSVGIFAAWRLRGSATPDAALTVRDRQAEWDDLRNQLIEAAPTSSLSPSTLTTAMRSNFEPPCYSRSSA